MQPINTVCGQNEELLIVKEVAHTFSNRHWRVKHRILSAGIPVWLCWGLTNYPHPFGTFSRATNRGHFDWRHHYGQQLWVYIFKINLHKRRITRSLLLLKVHSTHIVNCLNRCLKIKRQTARLHTHDILTTEWKIIAHIGWVYGFVLLQ